MLFIWKRNKKNNSVVPFEKGIAEKYKLKERNQQDSEGVVPFKRNNKNNRIADSWKRNCKV